MKDVLLRECRDSLRGYDVDHAILREVKHGAEIVLGETTLERGKPARLFVAVHSAKWDREQIYAVVTERHRVPVDPACWNPLRLAL